MDRELKLEHELPFTVTLREADHRLHMNHLKALEIFEVAQRDLLKTRGMSWDDIDQRFDVISVVQKHLETTYYSQVWPGEYVVVRTTLTTDSIRLHFVQEILRDEVVCVNGGLVRVFTRALKPVRIPVGLLEQLFGQSVPRTV